MFARWLCYYRISCCFKFLFVVILGFVTLVAFDLLWNLIDPWILFSFIALDLLFIVLQRAGGVYHKSSIQFFSGGCFSLYAC